MLHHNADAAALGLFQAAKESPGVYVFGSNADQTPLAPERVVGSAIIDLPRAFVLVAQEVKAGTFKPRVESFGIASGVVRYDPNPRLDSLVPAALKARVKAAADSIAAGTLLAAPRPGSMQASRPAVGPGRGLVAGPGQDLVAGPGQDLVSPQGHRGHRAYPRHRSGKPVCQG
jgi:basic membrane lipoprotein Med (substrate-binding protein (PBP1-ABC) superfamily)